MKKIKLALSIITIISVTSAVSMAATCRSNDIRRDLAEIQSLSIPEETKEGLVQDLKIAKTKQIIACSASNIEISRDDAVFAIEQLEARRKSQINIIENQNSIKRTDVDVATMSMAGRYLHNSMESDSTSRVKEINNWVDAVIARIKRNTK